MVFAFLVISFRRLFLCQSHDSSIKLPSVLHLICKIEQKEEKKELKIRSNEMSQVQDIAHYRQVEQRTRQFYPSADDIHILIVVIAILVQACARAHTQRNSLKLFRAFRLHFDWIKLIFCRCESNEMHFAIEDMKRRQNKAKQRKETIKFKK